MLWENLNKQTCPHCGKRTVLTSDNDIACTECRFKVEAIRAERIKNRKHWQNLKLAKCPKCASTLQEITEECLKFACENCDFKITAQNALDIINDPNHPANRNWNEEKNR